MSNNLIRDYSKRKDHIKGKSWVNKFKQGAKVALELESGNYIKGLTLAKELITKTKDPLASGIMRRRRNARSKGKGRRAYRRRSTPAAMKPIHLPVKRVVVYSKTSGSEHRWYYTVPLSLITASFTSTFDEFKVTNLTVKYVPNNSQNETGLYVSVLLDREGFGGYGTATAAAWFSYIGSMPGSLIKPRYIPTTHRWKPTEPSARDWIRAGVTHNLCTIYICNNGKETDELGGLLDIRATLLARGRYYDAAVSLPNITEFADQLEQACIGHHRPPSPAQSTSSQNSLVGGFSVL